MKNTSPRWKTSWKIYERPYDPQEPVVCLDEKPITLHADVRPALAGNTRTGSAPG